MKICHSTFLIGNKWAMYLVSTPLVKASRFKYHR